MREQERIVQERLKLLMNSREAPIDADDTIVATESLETPLFRADLDNSIRTALENRPEMQNADLAIRTGEARRSHARHNLLPSLNVGGSIRRNDSRTSTPVASSDNDYLGNDWTLGVSLSMPIGNMESRAQLRRADSELAQSVDEKRGVKSAVITEVRTAVRNLELLASEIPVSGQAVEAARKVADGELARFEINQMGNRDLLQAQDLLATAQRSRIQAWSRYNIALVKLFAAEGILLERLGCKFKQYRFHLKETVIHAPGFRFYRIIANEIGIAWLLSRYQRIIPKAKENSRVLRYKPIIPPLSVPDFAIEGGDADAQRFRRPLLAVLIVAEQPNGAENLPALQFRQGQDSLSVLRFRIGEPLSPGRFGGGAAGRDRGGTRQPRRQGGGGELAALVHVDHVFDAILEFADVARPVVGHEVGQKTGGKAQRRLP
jgi:hypothetical protein